MNQIFTKLRKYNRKNYMLYVFCNFISMLLITSYSMIMYSSTVRNVLPEGGDSRKQVMMIFVLTCVGCVVFTVYGARLFYRMKSRELGIMLALGATKKPLQKYLMKEILIICLTSSLAGMLCGIPFAAGIWKVFRIAIVDSEEMVLHFRYMALIVSFAFLLVVLLAAILSGIPVVKRTNIMEVVNEEHRNEMVHEIKPWCGFVGIILLIIGVVIGFLAPNWYMDLFSAYPPSWLAVLYIPAFIGVYMIILHTVVNGWYRNKKKYYKEIISRGMMKFQGRQTVNSMLVITLLLAGAGFALFYVPLMLVSSGDSIKGREYDYSYHCLESENEPTQEEVEMLGKNYDCRITEWKQIQATILAMDGLRRVEEKNGKFHDEYVKKVSDAKFMSASDYQYMTGQNISVEPGEYYGVSDPEENGTYIYNEEATLLTNMKTGQELTVKFCGYFHYNQLATRQSDEYYVINDLDYQKITQSVSKSMQEKVVFFQASNDSYAFAKEFYKNFLLSMSRESEQASGYSETERENALAAGEEYWGDTEWGEISFSDYETPDFKREWKYMPTSIMLDQTEMVYMYGVFFMMFIYIVIVCMIAAMVIAYIRCVTISINNRYVFEDLKRLGGSRVFLKKEIKKQSAKIFFIPTAIGFSSMYLLFTLILFMNDGYGNLSASEGRGLILCFFLLLLLAGVVCGIYRRVNQTMNKMLL